MTLPCSSAMHVLNLYFQKLQALEDFNTSLKSKCAALSGSDIVAAFCAEKVMELGELEACLLAEAFVEESESVASVGDRLTDAQREGVCGWTSTTPPRRRYDMD